MDNVEKYSSHGKVNLDTLGMHVERAVIGKDFPLHTHDFSETFIIVSGTATHVLGDWEYPIKKGDVYAVKGNVPHGFRQVHDLDIINLMYKPSFFKRSAPEVRSLPGFVPFFLLEPEARTQGGRISALTLGDDSLQSAVAMADLIIREEKKSNQNTAPVLTMTFGALTGYIAMQYDVRSELPESLSALTHAIAYMEQNLSVPLRVADIAQSVCLSSRQLERLFEEYDGQSPMKHLREIRLKNALSLLLRTECTVTEAAHASGFEDVSYFIRVFRQAYGMTPNMARKHMHEA